MNDKPKYNPNVHHRRSIRLKGYDYSQAGLYFITICCHNRECLFGQIVVGANNNLPDNLSNNLPDNEMPKMILNDAGKIADGCWLEIPKHFPNAVLHEYVVMPNHLHGIIELTDSNNVGAENFPHNYDGVINVGTNDVGENDYLSNNDDVIVGANDYSSNDDNVIVGANDYSPLRQNDADNNGAENFPPRRTPSKSPSKTIGSIVRGFKIGVTKWFRNIRPEDFPPQRNIWQRNYYEHIIRNEQSYQTISDYIINNPVKWADDKFYRE